MEGVRKQTGAALWWHWRAGWKSAGLQSCAPKFGLWVGRGVEPRQPLGHLLQENPEFKREDQGGRMEGRSLALHM